MILGRFWESFLEAFGSILASKSRSKFDHDFGMLFCRITGRGVALACRRRAVDAPAAGVPVPRIPPRRSPFRARNRKRDLTRSGPKALRIFGTVTDSEFFASGHMASAGGGCPRLFSRHLRTLSPLPVVIWPPPAVGARGYFRDTYAL